ncbi:glycoside hydrolase family 16 protein [Streptacidiphilus melanogenes]|uniref:glycoside hydrolase family 16 protein n=1 Tax=Streptacidiphilus melanogenes TaxID=411235 RepID=UPI0005A7DFAD|nr:glycoside hydrolase family 16 protein [Streptacidiphilus melanogenes]
MPWKAGSRRAPTWKGASALALAAALLLAACTSSPSRTTAGLTDPAPATPPAAPGNWHLAFSDEFQGSSLDTSRWTTCYDWNQNGCTNEANHELEWYQPGQATVADGSLTLTAGRKTVKGTDGHTYPWTSGMVSTGRSNWYATPRFTLTYGYVEASIRFPAEPGMFPAFWMMPQTRFVPPEIDIAEQFGDARTVRMTLHYPGPNQTDLAQYTQFGPRDFTSGFHTYAVDWEPSSLTWYIDGVQRFRITNPKVIPDTPMEVLLTLAVGYPQAPPADVDSGQMVVNWVRVWQH